MNKSAQIETLQGNVLRPQFHAVHVPLDATHRIVVLGLRASRAKSDPTYQICLNAVKAKT